jgi:3-methyladenine DNA glycosylase AlkC
MEDAIRFFINQYPKLTCTRLDTWVYDRNYHVRRLVSEGLRPRLPWSGRLVTPYAQALPYLDILHADATRYVTRSVANHLNDISKVDPSMVIQTLARWEKQNIQDKSELAWMIKHALRTLIKAGHKEALAHLGYGSSKVTVQKAYVTPSSIVAGEAITIAVELVTSVTETILVDYRIGFIKNNGRLAYKSYKLKTIEVTAQQPLTLTKSHRVRKDATTYTLYEGEHTVVLVINGSEHWVGSFLLQL